MRWPPSQRNAGQTMFRLNEQTLRMGELWDYAFTRVLESSSRGRLLTAVPISSRENKAFRSFW